MKKIFLTPRDNINGLGGEFSGDGVRVVVQVQNDIDLDHIIAEADFVKGVQVSQAEPFEIKIIDDDDRGDDDDTRKISKGQTVVLRVYAIGSGMFFPEFLISCW